MKGVDHEKSPRDGIINMIADDDKGTSDEEDVPRSEDIPSPSFSPLEDNLGSENFTFPVLSLHDPGISTPTPPSIPTPTSITPHPHHCHQQYQHHPTSSLPPPPVPFPTTIPCPAFVGVEEVMHDLPLDPSSYHKSYLQPSQNLHQQSYHQQFHHLQQSPLPPPHLQQLPLPHLQQSPLPPPPHLQQSPLPPPPHLQQSPLSPPPHLQQSPLPPPPHLQQSPLPPPPHVQQSPTPTRPHLQQPPPHQHQQVHQKPLQPPHQHQAQQQPHHQYHHQLHHQPHQKSPVLVPESQFTPSPRDALMERFEENNLSQTQDDSFDLELPEIPRSFPSELGLCGIGEEAGLGGPSGEDFDLPEVTPGHSQFTSSIRVVTSKSINTTPVTIHHSNDLPELDDLTRRLNALKR
eukprot:TRINITY_DN3180_c0_g1_i3.p1 TRINITY_DN3180_c0_g1~~TRINITY_DN3180_c0_g1_i3.p1  ORF type:complete len:404 (+),score=118.94 TRINITY_DN3180_c0_g1_i3:1067-2278(+)